MTVEQLMINMSVALVLGLAVFLAYRISYTGVSYSKKFNTSLVMMALITTAVMSVISSNIALSLGMVGALSVVRFRTAIKDPRDTTFIFWCIGIGICCGVSQFMVAAVSSAFIFIFLLIMGGIRYEGKYMLIIQCSRDLEHKVEAAVYQHYGHVFLRVKNTMQDDMELIYEISSRTIKQIVKKNPEVSIIDQLYKLEGMKRVNLVAQNDNAIR